MWLADHYLPTPPLEKAKYGIQLSAPEEFCLSHTIQMFALLLLLLLLFSQLTAWNHYVNINRQQYVNTILLCKAAGFEESNFTFGVKVAFVADEYDDDVWTGEGACIRQPVW